MSESSTFSFNLSLNDQTISDGEELKLTYTPTSFDYQFLEVEYAIAYWQGPSIVDTC